MSRTIRLVLAAALALALPASAQTLYKLIGKDGKVTYSEEKPKYFEGQVIQIDVNPNANTATLPKPANREEPRDGAPRKPAKGAAKPGQDAPQLTPEQRLERAKKALEDARNNPGEGDMLQVGKVGGGVRTIQSEGYAKRLERLERELKEAEDEFRRSQ